MADSPLLSIIVTAYKSDRLRDIFELLDSIMGQTYPKIETMFVAERSKELLDKIRNYVAEKSGANINVLFNDGEPGLSAARNLGIKAARGDIVGFVDDDVLLLPNWAEETVRSYANSNIIGVTGPALPLWEDKAMSWFPEEFYWIISCTAWSNLDKVTEVRNAWGMNMSFRREAFEQAGYFASGYGLHDSHRTSWVDPPSEDVDLSLRIKAKTGKSIIFNPAVVVRHRVYGSRLAPSFIWRRAYSVGYQRRMLKKLYPEADAHGDLLRQEHQLLKRILTHLFPDIGRTIFRHPGVAGRKLTAVVAVLLAVASGYYLHIMARRR